MVVVGDPRGGRRPRGRVLLVAAAAGLLALAGAAIATRSPDTRSANDAPAGSSFHFATPQVVLDAASVVVDAGGRSFVPPTDVAIHSDPGTPNQYTTLELEWNAQGVPMRIYMYFASDGTNWWATEIRTYDGSAAGEWIEMPGKYFTSPLGTAFQGDLDLRSLHIHGLKLEAFRRPDACTNPGKPLALVADYAKVDSPPGMYGASVTLIDTATCAPAPIDRVTISTSTDDPEIATILNDPQGPELPIGRLRISLDLPKAGTTTVHVVVRDRTTNELIDQVDIPVIVH
jgi:hypothetical protein